MTFKEIYMWLCAWLSVVFALISGAVVIWHSITFPLEGAALTVGIICGVIMIVCGALMIRQIKNGGWRE